MIIVINGPMGVGKSSVSWALLDLMQDTVLLEGDYLSAYSAHDYTNKYHLEETFELMALMMDFHIKKGKQHFIINWVFESPEVLAKLQDTLQVHHLPIKVFRLDCSVQTLTARIKRRNLENLTHELRRGPELKGILDQWGSQLGHIIDTELIDPNGGAEIILQICTEPCTTN